MQKLPQTLPFEPKTQLNPSTIQQLYPEIHYLPSPQGEILAWNDLGRQFFLAAMMFALQERVLFYRLGETHHYSTILYPNYSDPIPTYLDLAANCFQQAPPHFISTFNRLILQFLLSQTASTKNQYLSQLKNQLPPLGESQQQPMMRKILRSFENLDLHKPEPAWKTLTQTREFHTQGGLSFNLLSPDYRLTQSLMPKANELALAFVLHRQLLLGELSQGHSFRFAIWREARIKLILESESPDLARKKTLAVQIQAAPDDRIPPLPVHWETGPAQAFDLICLWDLSTQTYHQNVVEAWQNLHPQGYLFGALPRSQVDPPTLQKALFELTQSWPTLIDRESFSDTLIFYLTKTPPPPFQTQGLILMRPDSIITFGGADFQMFKSRAVLKTLGIHTDISLACRLDFETYDFLYTVGYLHEEYIYHRLKQTHLPRLAMPICSLDYAASCFVNDVFEQLQAIALDLKAPPTEVIFRYLASTQINQAQWIQKTMARPHHRQMEKSHQKLSQTLGSVSDLLLPQGQAEIPYIFPQAKVLSAIPYQVLPNGCDPEIFIQADPQVFREKLGFEDFILCVGRIEPNKNQLSLVYALRETEIPIVLIGRETEELLIEDLKWPSPSEGYLELCQWLGNGRVYQFQNLPVAELASAYKAAKLFVLPSACENYPLCTLEAAFANTPVVMTQNSLQNELFADCFYFFDPLSFQAIRDTVLTAWRADNQQRIQIARQKVEQYCTWRAMGQAMAEAIEQLLQRPQGVKTHWQNGAFVQIVSDLNSPPILTHPVLYALEDLCPFWHLPPAQQKAYAPYPWQAKSALEKWHLEKQGFCHVQLQIPSRQQIMPAESELSVLLDLKTTRFLCFYHPEGDFYHPEILALYLRSFGTDHDTSLVLYVPPEYGEPEVEAQIFEILDPLGLDAETIPDLSVMMGPTSASAEALLFQAMDLIIAPFKSLWGHEALLYQTWQTHPQIASFQFDPNLTSSYLLADFETLSEFEPLATLSYSEDRLSEYLQSVYQAKVS